MATLESFQLFPKLIPELRIHIWACALQIPRLVVIWKHESRGSDYIRRSVASPLLCTTWESRREALRYYASPQTGPCILPPWPPVPLPSIPPSSLRDVAAMKKQIEVQSATNPHYVGPGTDILYIRGSDPLNRRYKPISWACVFLSHDLESPSPTFAPIRRLAVDEMLLRTTPFSQFSNMPYSIWKLVISDLRQLDELVVVRHEGTNGWDKREVEMALKEAKIRFAGYLENCWGDDCDEKKIQAWDLPEVRLVSFVELVRECWTSWK